MFETVSLQAGCPTLAGIHRDPLLHIQWAALVWAPRSHRRLSLKAAHSPLLGPLDVSRQESIGPNFKALSLRLGVHFRAPVGLAVRHVT